MRAKGLRVFSTSAPPPTPMPPPQPKHDLSPASADSCCPLSWSLWAAALSSLAETGEDRVSALRSWHFPSQSTPRPGHTLGIFGVSTTDQETCFKCKNDHFSSAGKPSTLPSTGRFPSTVELMSLLLLISASPRPARPQLVQVTGFWAACCTPPRQKWSLLPGRW